MLASRRIFAALPRAHRLMAIVASLAVAGTSAPGHAQEVGPGDVEREVEALAEQEKYREMAERIDAALKQIPEATETRVRRNLLVSKAINGYRLAFEQAPDGCELAEAGVSLADEYLPTLLSVYGVEAELSDEYVGISALRQKLALAGTTRGCQAATAPKALQEASTPPPRVEPEPSLLYPIVGLEGNVLVGGGSQRLVGLFSLRMGGGGLMDESRPAIWLVGGPAILAKINRRWSMGGHIEAGVLGAPFTTSGSDRIVANFAAEVGFDFAWHFGPGRRDGI